MALIYIPGPGFFSMDGWKSLFVSLVFSVILSVGLSYVAAPYWGNPSVDGSVGQSPVLYIVIILSTLLIGAVFHWVLRPSEGSSFNFWLFVCVAFSGLMIGGIIHEFTHVVLISHPTQFRVHFGDSGSILSTCCLNPGEYDYELVAYAIQFLVMIGWIFAFREYFFQSSPPLLSPQKKSALPSPKKASASHSRKIKSPPRSQELVDEEEDPEWAAAKRESERLLRKSGERDSDSLRNESMDLRRLKIPKRE
ncbi:MAG: Yip1 family protein [archaeon]